LETFLQIKEDGFRVLWEDDCIYEASSCSN